MIVGKWEGLRNLRREYVDKKEFGTDGEII